jgi:hypothetical protein
MTVRSIRWGFFLVPFTAALSLVHCGGNVPVGFTPAPPDDSGSGVDSGTDPGDIADSGAQALFDTTSSSQDAAPPSAAFFVLAAQTPAGPSVQSTWGGVLRYDVGNDGMPAVAATSIDKSALWDPAGLAFRAESAELFIGNRHGMDSTGGVPGSISRFRYDADTRGFTPNGEISGNGLAGVCQVTFNPVTGEMFAANRAGGGVSRFTFDSKGTAVPNGTIGTGTPAGVAVAPDGKRLYVTAASDTIQQFDLTTNTQLSDVVLVGAGSVDLHFMAIFGNVLYAPGIAAALVYRLTIGPNDDLTLKDTIPTDNPIAVAFSPDGQEMFVAPHQLSTLIDRFKYDPNSGAWTPTTKIDAGTSMGALLTFAEDARPTITH